jgi:hypothetical protein
VQPAVAATLDEPRPLAGHVPGGAERRGSDLRLGIVIPVFNDFASFARLCRELDFLAVEWGATVSILGIDDGSLEPCDRLLSDAAFTHVDRVLLTRLKCNLGHQRAIAVGLVEAAKNGNFDAVLVADSDGEDRPADFGRLIAAYRTCPRDIVVAARAERSESWRFRTFYRLYKFFFRMLAGRRIDFGNFILIPRPLLARVITMAETWSHLAASILRSRLPIRAVACKRGTRYAGRSHMNFVGLLIHGLSALAVFSDEIFARMLATSAFITVLATVMAVTALVVRVGTKLAIPGWTTNVVGISLILLSESLLFAMVASLMMLHGRSAVRFVPSEHAGVFVEESLTLYDRTGRARDTSAHG